VNPFDAYIHVKPDGKISLIVAKSEMGQGIKTGLAMILAEEAEVDFNSVSVEQAETRPDIYAHMGTGGSEAPRKISRRCARPSDGSRIDDHRRGSEVECSERTVPRRKGAVLHEKSSRSASYGELVEAAEKLPRPDPEKFSSKMKKILN